MLISMKRKSNCDESVYKCDRCNEQMKGIDRFGVYIAENNNSVKKKWDLCRNCYKSLVIGIRKGK